MTDLESIKGALEQLNEQDLGALLDASNQVPGHARGMSSWISTACEWELNRRGGLEYGLPLPLRTIPPQADGISIGAAFAVRATFAKETPAVREFFDALVDVLMHKEQSP